MQVAKLPAEHSEFKSLTKPQLHALADELLAQDPATIDYCVKFVLAETKGLWHGRGRAMLSRRLKHCSLSRNLRAGLLRCILARLRTGEFSEQFKDQLRLALHLDSKQALLACQEALSSPKAHVVRYAAWAVALPRGENAA
jgi:hypothetical protein